MTAVVPSLRGTPRALAAALGGSLTVEDVYDAGAGLYDALVRADQSEIAEMVAVSRGIPGDVLDLGCGAGRLTLPFLVRGRRVMAVDLSPAMIDLLLAKVASLPPRVADGLEAVVGDMARLELDRQFGLILLGTTSVTLLSKDDRRDTLAMVRRGLTDEGRFLVSTLDVDPHHVETREQVHVAAVAGHEGRVVLATLFDELDLDRARRHVTILEQGLTDASGFRLFHSEPRIVTEQQLRDELGAAGLEVVNRWVLSKPHPGQRVVLLACGGAG